MQAFINFISLPRQKEASRCRLLTLITSIAFPQQREVTRHKLSRTQSFPCVKGGGTPQTSTNPSLPCVKGGGFCAAKLGGIVYIIPSIYWLPKLTAVQSLTRYAGAPFTQGSLFIGLELCGMHLCTREPFYWIGAMRYAPLHKGAFLLDWSYAICHLHKGSLFFMCARHAPEVRKTSSLTRGFCFAMWQFPLTGRSPSLKPN